MRCDLKGNGNDSVVTSFMHTNFPVLGNVAESAVVLVVTS